MRLKFLSPECLKLECAEIKTVKSSDFGVFSFLDVRFLDIHCTLMQQIHFVATALIYRFLHSN